MKYIYSIISLFLCIAFGIYVVNPTTVAAIPPVPLSEKIGEMLIIGFKGTKSSEKEVLKISDYLKERKVGGVIFYDYNIKSPNQTKSLIRHFKSLTPNKKNFIAIDQEGGYVQRLTRRKGFKSYPSSHYLAQTKTLQDAYLNYLDMAKLLQDIGFNLNFGTVVDINVNPNSPAIGRLKRSYSSDPTVVSNYAEKMIDAHRHYNIISAIKHFPGHGSAYQDSHKGVTNVTNTWSHIELLPYKILLDKKKVDMIMTAHIFHMRIDPFTPASLSKQHIHQTLRDFLSYDGVIITDDLQMRAISNQFDLKTVIIKTIQSEIDILLFAHLYLYDENIVERAHQIITEAVENGELDEQLITNAYKRIQKLKSETIKKGNYYTKTTVLTHD